MFVRHINVELCISWVGGINYLFKYFCKGLDRVTVEWVGEEQGYDEITSFMDARYISASEGAWRLLRNDLVNRKLDVVRLDVHLQDHHKVHYREQNAKTALERDRPGTKLTKWFVANQQYTLARHIRYDNFPKHFTWARTEKVETERKAESPNLNHFSCYRVIFFNPRSTA